MCGQTCVWRSVWPKFGRLLNYGHVDTTNLVERHWQFIKYIALRGRINWFIIGNLGQSLPQDAILVEEVDAASIAKHKNNMDHIIDPNLSNSSMSITDNNLSDSLVGEAHPKDNRILMQDDEGLGMKGDETLPLIVYEKNESHTIIKEDSNVEKSGEEINLLQIVSAEICHSPRENTHNCKGRITRSKAKYLESGLIITLIKKQMRQLYILLLIR